MSNATAYPVVYRMSMRWQLPHYLLSVCFALIGIFLLANLMPQVNFLDLPIVLLVMCGAVMLGACAAVALRASSYRLTLGADAITKEHAFYRYTLSRSDILGYSFPNARRKNVLEITPRSINMEGIQLRGEVEIDARFTAWLEGLNDFASHVRDRIHAEVMNDTALGATPEARMKTVQFGYRLALAGNVLAVALILTSWIHPLPNRLDLDILACMPLAVVALLCFSRGLFRLDGSNLSLRPKLKFMLLVPSFALALYAVREVNLVSGLSVWLLAFAGYEAFGFLLQVANRKMRQPTDFWPVYAILMASWGYGAGALLNTEFDAAPVETYRAVVTDRHMSGRDLPRLYVRLAPWGPVSVQREHAVDWDLYGSAGKSRGLCPQLHEGVLGLQWYTINGC